MAESTSSGSDIPENPPDFIGNGRSELLEKILEKTVDRFSSSIGFSLFKKHFPDICKQDKEGLRSTHTQFVKELKNKISVQVHKDFVELKLPELLKGLDQIIEQADGEKNEKAWRPSGNPNEDIKPHRIAVKLQAVEAYEELLRELHREREQAEAALLQSKEKLSELEHLVDEKAMLFEKAAAACQQLPLPKIEQYLADQKSNSDCTE